VQLTYYSGRRPRGWIGYVTVYGAVSSDPLT
jgi:hypothetical protein